MKKRGQITLFIILAIVVIAAIVIVLLVRTKFSFGNEIAPEVGPIHNYVEACINDELVAGIKLTELNGGYINTPEQYLQTEDLGPIAYGYYEGDNVLASKEKIGEEISNYIKAELPGCLDGGAFPEFDIEKGSVTANTEIKGDDVSASITYPLTISKAGTTYNLRDFSGETISEINNLHLVANELVNQLVEDPDNIDMTYLTNLDYNVIIIPYDENTFIYSIHDLDEEGEITQIFRFANKLR